MNDKSGQMMHDAPDRPVRPMVNSVVQAVAILRHLGTLPGGAGVNAIARATQIGPSSCFNVLRTLVSEDLVAFDPASKRYTLGLGTIDLARAALGGDPLVAAAQAPMAVLADRHEAAIGLWRLSGARLVLVALAESAAATRIHMMVGQRQPASAGATGRAVLAERNLSDSALAQAHAEVRWHSPPGLDAFAAQVAHARTRGWAEDRGNNNLGIATVAAAITDGTGEVRFVLSASIFDGREDQAGMDRIGAALRDAAHALNKRVYGGKPQGE